MSTVLYRVEIPRTNELGPPLSYRKAVAAVKVRIKSMPAGEHCRVVKVAYNLNPLVVPTLHTPAIERIWGATISQFPDIGHVGVYVCKDPGYVSQHIHGNAGDWVGPKNMGPADEKAYLDKVARWTVQQKDSLPVAQVIWQDRIWTPENGWAHYSGVNHVSHVHVSGDPMDLSTDCG